MRPSRVEALMLLGASALCIPSSSCGSKDPPSRPAVESASAPAGAAWFEEISEQAGVSFVSMSGHADRFLMPEIANGGVALTDVDNDGDLDLYLVQSGSVVGPVEDNPPNALYANDGGGRFTDVTASSGAGDRGYGMGVACGDYDNDGNTDLYVTNLGPNALFRNEGGCKFSDVRRVSGTDHGGWGSSCAFLDYDRDGWLDLYVCNYLDWSVESELDCYNGMGGLDYCGPKNYYAPAVDVLYHNQADGTFADVSEAAGLTAKYGTGLGVAAADFNGDGWLDIFVANDGMQDQLWINRNGSFVDEGVLSGCALDNDGVVKAGMGVAVDDIDFDGDPDLIVCNLHGESDSYYINEGGIFSDSTARMGLSALSRPFTRFGVGLLDFDNDGYLDLYESNGRVTSQARRFVDDDVYAEPNLLFRGAGGGRFTEVLPRGGTAEPLIATSRGAAFGDFDNDGGVDLVVANRDGRAHLLRNVVPDRGNWVVFRVQEDGRDALNAVISMQVEGRTITREVRAAYSYQASNDPRVHVGIGAARKVTQVRVTWPDRTVTQFGDYEAGTRTTLERPTR